jgi:hypothetical protein
LSSTCQPAPPASVEYVEALPVASTVANPLEHLMRAPICTVEDEEGAAMLDPAPDAPVNLAQFTRLVTWYSWQCNAGYP